MPRRNNINFHKSNSDRKAERSLKAVFYNRLVHFRSIPDRVHNHIRSKFPQFHGRISSYLRSFKSPK